ncbi:hypothetical protein BDP81DRAFT_388852 [Colletotrichum phormii]|uniref:Uncharacterized protein n=1 Tax=Colletotrichum phormii TaxID=359342 RepID=A0AAJ0ELX0_9PEZI|nr:uncharacterized protein BDP81DRAFT_388852 [Colletotrichum phormii]KAK1655997.1 hypothetical protein BDP81DRAFT_388852 [Colletotrichum phormii]
MNGTFAAASTTNLFLASRDVAWSAPKGLGFVFVDPEARDDHRREALFHGLGVKKLSKREICERIVEDHRTKDKRDGPRPLDCLVEEMVQPAPDMSITSPQMRLLTFSANILGIHQLP